jgi:hypothetical protein
MRREIYETILGQGIGCSGCFLQHNLGVFSITGCIKTGVVLVEESNASTTQI